MLAHKGCVLHATHGKGATLEQEFAGTLAWFQNPASQVSAHVVIAADGTVCGVVHPDLQAWHAKSHNADHLGIEFVKRDPHLYKDVLTDAQYKSAAWLLLDWARVYAFALDEFTLPEHREIQTDKIDIGEGFDRDKLMEWIGRFFDA
jgi:N-acetyl-anhydromuramyl-L-alanine amidase AmpD